ncbi:C-mannosyltransferase dpy-19 homolog [Drosophila guanche]|uniref:Blast:C-mannosyltransferase dpy-19 homolog n=1 Tax=Drosophila guanche TaxID=7266 RepID=A0A3B0J6U0_DROGU|nr:C-mannosyltransferase dpy-19 homolog [Drosophila guanche]XP_034123790.1 C-mannosyltransferase dpy-19 homolog [Drosophila guanche]SPP77904.1 blast:C-mannosyltransferase dpy-19 homolog [Drosophila guanche]
MREPNFYIILSTALIGSGFFFLYMQHVRVIFETRTSIQTLNQLEREALLRREDALYYTFYKKLVDGPDFWHGYEQLKNVTDIEYPNSVNVLQRFYVLPELVAAYFFHLVRSGYNPILQPMQFYFEFVWLMGGVTLLVLYLYGTLLSENVFGGIYGVISYLMFHSFVSKIYERPVARENFAFPFIFLQMFYLCICIGRVIHRQKHSSRLFMIFVLSMFTACALLSWQFSTIIFATQIMIVMTSWNMNTMPTHVANAFALDYSLSHLLGNGIAFVLSHGNSQLLFTWQLSVSTSLFLITVVRQVRSRRHSNDPLQSDYFSFKFILLALVFAGSMQEKLVDVLRRTGMLNVQDNNYVHYCDLWAHWALQVNVNFVTNLSACNPLYARVAWSELWLLVKTLIVKPYCMYGVVMLAMFFRKWRKSNVPATASQEQRERARNYVLEDFLEEHHVSMTDMSNKQTEQQLQQCFKMLESCDHDYERYKRRKAKLQQQQPPARDDFMKNIKRLKAQIHRNSDKQRKERQQHHGSQLAAATNETKEQAELELDQETGTGTATETETATAEAEEAAAVNDDVDDDETQQPSNAEEAMPAPGNGNGNGSGSQAKPKAKCSSRRSSSSSSGVVPTANTQIFNMHYMYSFLQMVVFTILGLAVRKLFFLSFTQGCVIAPTICSKVWYHRQRNIFWSVSLAVFLLSMFDPGMVNIREEYFPAKYEHNADDLESMLEWIKLNTEPDAVFAGPVEIIGTVHLTTRRPIVNHAHLEMRQMAERTEHAYSVYSRQQSSDIYKQCAELKIQYLIISLDECTNEVRDDCDLLSIWDDKQPANRKYPQFCHELLHKQVPSFLKVYTNDNYGIIKMFSQSVQIILKHAKMPEMAM